MDQSVDIAFCEKPGCGKPRERTQQTQLVVVSVNVGATVGRDGLQGCVISKGRLEVLELENDKVAGSFILRREVLAGYFCFDVFDGRRPDLGPTVASGLISIGIRISSVGIFWTCVSRIMSRGCWRLYYR